MSNLYLKVKDVQLIETHEFEPFSGEPKTVKHWLIKTGFSNSDISVKVNPDKPKIEVVDIDEHDESIRELLRAVRKMDMNDKIKVFGPADVYSIMDTYTFSEIRDKYDDWKKPKVGDEVECDFGYGFKAIILDIFKRDGKECATLLVKNDESVSIHPLSDVEKTGRHFDNISISALAEYMVAKGNSLHF